VVLVVAVPMVAGALTRRTLVWRFGPEFYRQRIAPVFPGLSTLGVLGIVFVAVGLKARMILGEPRLLLAIAVPLLVFYAANFALSTLIGRALLPRGDAIAVVYGTVMRNLSIALGIAVAQFGPEAALVLAAAYIVQVQSAAWYVKLTDRVFGTPVAAPAEEAPGLAVPA
jgi:ACR3 family arsenite efflux pump ArsB